MTDCAMDDNAADARRCTGWQSRISLRMHGVLPMSWSSLDA